MSGHAQLHTDEGAAADERAAARARSSGSASSTPSPATPRRRRRSRRSSRTSARSRPRRGRPASGLHRDRLEPAPDRRDRTEDPGRDRRSVVQFNYDPGNVVYYTGAVPEEDLEYALDRARSLPPEGPARRQGRRRLPAARRGRRRHPAHPAPSEGDRLLRAGVDGDRVHELRVARLGGVRGGREARRRPTGTGSASDRQRAPAVARAGDAWPPRGPMRVASRRCGLRGRDPRAGLGRCCRDGVARRRPGGRAGA